MSGFKTTGSKLEPHLISKSNLPAELQATTTQFPLLSLPAELRLRIYHYLTPLARLPTVLRSRSLGVSAVTHRPPPVSFLLCNQQLCSEALDVFYRTTTFKIEGLLDPANVWPIWQIERVLLQSPQLAKMTRVELSGFWFRVPSGGVEGDGNAKYAECVIDEVAKRRDRVQRAVDVLLLATDLRVVVLTWKELGRRIEEEDEGWEARRHVLSPLAKLARFVRFEIGDLVASNPEVAERMVEFVEELNSVRWE